MVQIVPLDSTAPTGPALPTPAPGPETRPAKGPTQRDANLPIATKLGRPPAPPEAPRPQHVSLASRREGPPLPATAPTHNQAPPPAPPAEAPKPASAPPADPPKPPLDSETKSQEELRKLSHDGLKLEKDTTEHQLEANKLTTINTITSKTSERLATRWKGIMDSLSKVS